MKKVKFILDNEVARWARIRATERNVGISRLLRDMLREKMQEEEAYLLIMDQYLAAGPNILEKAEGNLPPQEAVHES
jgi:hypothetical protein